MIRWLGSTAPCAIKNSALSDWSELGDDPTAAKKRRFAYGNNAAIAPGTVPADQNYNDKPDFILLLNPDTIVRPGAITALLDFMQINPKVGIAGSRLEDPDGTPQRSAFRFHSIAGEFERGIRMGIRHRLLANKMIAPPVTDKPDPLRLGRRREHDRPPGGVRKAGLMDEKYFMYFEEVDFCLAARRAGWPCWYVPGQPGGASGRRGVAD
jgi:N-acetylglucosaminyl-diphospho-decaprenol L-rhamnosyltransferase